MHADYLQLMKEATRLTRTGDLRAAVAAIRSALGGRSNARAAADGTDDVIDVEARVMPAATAQPAGEASAWRQTAEDLHDAGGTPSDAGLFSPQEARYRPDAVTEERFIAAGYAAAAGHRDYKLYIPPGAGGRPLPLVVMLHGCTQDPDDFAAGTAMNDAARASGFYVLYPAQSQQANPQRCWNWFKHNHQERGRGEPALLAGMTRDVMARHAIDPQRVYVAGLSAGGAMAAILGASYPELYAAVGIHSGLAAGAASDLPSALAAMKGHAMRGRHSNNGDVPAIVFHGDADKTVHPGNGEQIIAPYAGTASASETQRVPARGALDHDSTRHIYLGADGQVVAEYWVVHGAAHAWAGGDASGSYTDARGPDASAEMLRFFFEHPQPPAA